MPVVGEEGSGDMGETPQGRRVLGAIWFIVMVVALVVAAIVQPIGEWGGFGILIGLLGALLAIVGLWMLVTGRGHVLSESYSRRTQTIIAVIGLIAVTIVLVSTLVTDWGTWTAVDALTLGVWISIGAMFALSLGMLAGSRRA